MLRYHIQFGTGDFLKDKFLAPINNLGWSFCMAHTIVHNTSPRRGKV